MKTKKTKPKIRSLKWHNKICMKITEIFATSKKNKRLDKLANKIYKDAKKAKLTQKGDKEKIKKYVYVNVHYSEKIISQLAKVYNYYGPNMGAELIANIVADYVNNTVNPKRVDDFFNYLKIFHNGGTVDDFIKKQKLKNKTKLKPKDRRMFG